MASLMPGNIYQGNCIDRLREIRPGSVDLAFADPPFNIGYEYDVYDDRRQAEEYVEWCRQWMLGIATALKPDGTFWLAIGDEFAAELKVLAQQELGLSCRSWVIWYYTFGVNCVRNFTRSHTHLFYFVANPKRFTFNAEDPAIRVPSARQLVYADKRANPFGRLPDNTWILRPQDVEHGFLVEEDTWYFSRVAGTFKERAGFHGCQMPEQLLGRIIRACSLPEEIVLDPFAGSGTTLAVAKKLGRQWIGIELSPQYVEKASARIAAATCGQPLDGPADPIRSAPATPSPAPTNGHSKKTIARPKRTVLQSMNRELGLADAERGVIDAFKQVHSGFSVDRLLADAALNSLFLDTCQAKGLPGSGPDWNRALINLRKTRRLPRSGYHSRMFSAREMDRYSFASEIALAQMSKRQLSLDDILCDPRLAAEFDQLAAQYAPDFTPLEYRWAALAIRKRAKEYRDHASKLPVELTKAFLEPAVTWSRIRIENIAPVGGVYVLCGRQKEFLYAGESFNLRERFEYHKHREVGSVRRLNLPRIRVKDRFALQLWLIGRLEPRLNYADLACRSIKKS